MTESKPRARRRRPRYRVDSKGVRIEIKVKSVSQLFDARDPAPFLERDLDDDAVEYLVSSAEEFSLRTPLKLVIHVADSPEASLPESSIRESIHNYFEYQAEIRRKKLVRYMKTGQWFLLMGLCFLAMCLFLADLVSKLPEGPLQTLVREGFVIMGWVAMWRPIDLFLFDWWPAYEKRRYFEKLATIEIEVRYAKPSEPSVATPA